MKQAKKHFNLCVTLVLLIFAVICLINITYSYFTTASKTNGNFTFGNLDVNFKYFESGNSEGKDESGNTISLYTSTGAIEIGTPFKLSKSAGGAEITNLSITNEYNSSACFVRFWIDAYIIDGDTVDKSVNYGKYFVLPTESTEENPLYYSNQGGSVSDSGCYFGIMSIDPMISIYLGNTLTLVDAADNILANILGETIQISITFEAVQKANKAYLSVFNDERGYYLDWGNEFEE
ncbi:MAG: hypothetical protein J6Q13_00725 [Clostridia bacterium]|nr:hypothetical protein [Clostridia bacterium]